MINLSELSVFRITSYNVCYTKLLRNPQLSASSNPYEYIQNNKNFNDLVNLGTDALPVIAEKIMNSNDDGLKEYILAIAAEKIAKIDLVITSYSIHYTKLYESVRRLQDT